MTVLAHTADHFAPDPRSADALRLAVDHLWRDFVPRSFSIDVLDLLEGDDDFDEAVSKITGDTLYAILDAVENEIRNRVISLLEERADHVERGVVL